VDGALDFVKVSSSGPRSSMPGALLLIAQISDDMNRLGNISELVEIRLHSVFGCVHFERTGLLFGSGNLIKCRFGFQSPWIIDRSGKALKSEATRA
jgi:hypothetical protein